jgi:phosphatidylglycerol---prolipoprotein diacylglyceryl transferase
MLTISVNPVAFTIGSLPIRWYGIMVAIAVASLLVIMARETKRIGITRDIYSIFLWGIIGGIVGGRLAYVIYDWSYFAAHPLDVFGFHGLAQNGMVIGIVVAALIYMRVTRMRFSMLLSIGDAVAVGAPLALAIARIGCTLNGCCSGQPSPFHFFPLAVIYTPRDSMDPQYWNTPLYFTEFYHLLWGLTVFGIVWQFRGKLKPEGSLLFLFFCVFAAGDFAIRFLRTDVPVLWGLRQAQVLDLAILAIFLPWLVIRMRRFKKKALAAELANEAEQEQNHED